MSAIINCGGRQSPSLWKKNDRIGGITWSCRLCIIFILVLFIQLSVQSYTITKFESEIKLTSDSLCIAKVTERVSYIFDKSVKTITRTLPLGMPFGNNVEELSAIIVTTTSNKIIAADVYKTPSTDSNEKYIQIDLAKPINLELMTIEYKYSIKGPFFTFKNSTKFQWSIGNEPAQSIGDIQVSVKYPTSLLSNIKTFPTTVSPSIDGPETTITYKSAALKSMQTFTPGFTASNMIFTYCNTTIHNPNVTVAMVTMYGPIIALMFVSLLIKAIVDNVKAHREEMKFEQERNRIGKDIQLNRRPISAQYSHQHHTDDSELSYDSEEESHENQTLLSKTNKAFNEL